MPILLQLDGIDTFNVATESRQINHLVQSLTTSRFGRIDRADAVARHYPKMREMA